VSRPGYGLSEQAPWDVGMPPGRPGGESIRLGGRFPVRLMSITAIAAPAVMTRRVTARLSVRGAGEFQ